jgi:hypothetical protein
MPVSPHLELDQRIELSFARCITSNPTPHDEAAVSERENEPSILSTNPRHDSMGLPLHHFSDRTRTTSTRFAPDTRYRPVGRGIGGVFEPGAGGATPMIVGRRRD